MSALSLAVLVEQHSGVETLLQYSCRDKNLLGIQSDLLGAFAMGLRNLLGITGDVRTLGDIPDATAVFEAIVLDGKTMADAGTGLYEQLGRSQRAARLRAAFRLVANLLHGRIAHVLPAE